MNVSALDRALVGRVLEVAGADIEIADVRFLGEGWDNRLFLVNQDLVIRVARGEVDDARLVTEARLLDVIAPRLPLPVPRPEFVLAPSAELPRAVMGYRLMPGTPLDTGMVTATNAERLGDDLAPFLEDLHRLPLEIARDVDLPFFTAAEWLERHRELVGQTWPYVRRQLDRESADRFRRWWRSYVSHPVSLDFESCLIHGDLAAEHVLAEPDPWRVSGVIDFGDAMVADPALDLAGFPDALARAVMRRMPNVVSPEHVWRRRDAYRRLSPLHAVFAGLDRSDSTLLDEGILGLRRRFNG